MDFQKSKLTVSDTDKAYFETSVEKLEELYKAHLPHLTFERVIEVRSLDTKDAQRLEELQKEVESLKQKNAELQNATMSESDNYAASLAEAYDKKFEEMDRQMKAMQDFIAKLDPNVLDKLKPSKHSQTFLLSNFPPFSKIILPKDITDLFNVKRIRS